MRQITLAAGTFETYRKPTRRERFLADMEKGVPWHNLCAVIAPYYPKGENGRKRSVKRGIAYFVTSFLFFGRATGSAITI